MDHPYDDDGALVETFREKAEALLADVRTWASEQANPRQRAGHEPATCQTLLVMLLAMNTADMAGVSASPEHLIKGIALTSNGLIGAVQVEHEMRTIPRGTDVWANG